MKQIGVIAELEFKIKLYKVNKPNRENKNNGSSKDIKIIQIIIAINELLYIVEKEDIN